MDNDYERGHSYADIRREIEGGPRSSLLSTVAIYVLMCLGMGVIIAPVVMAVLR